MGTRGRASESAVRISVPQSNHRSSWRAPFASDRTFDEAQDGWKKHGSDNRDDDGADQATSDADSHYACQPATDERTDDTGNDIHNQIEAGTFHDLAG